MSLERLLLADGDVLFGVALVLGLLGEHRVVQRERTQSSDVFASEATAVKGEIEAISLSYFVSVPYRWSIRGYVWKRDSIPLNSL